MKSSQWYRVTGLTIESEFPLLHIEAPAERTEGPADVSIRWADDAEMGEGWIDQLLTPNSTPADILCQPLPELRIRIKDGNTILLHCSAPLPAAEVSVYLTGLAWGLLCHQRGLLPLHCSAVDVGGQAFAFTGASGAGKSTLLRGLMRRGYHRCCDDIMVTSQDSPPRILDMASGIKLWDDAIAHFGEHKVSDLRVRGDRRKYHLSGSAQAHDRQRPLAAVYVLETHDAAPAITRLSGYSAWRELYSSIYRIDMVPWINTKARLVAQIDPLVRSVPVFSFTRPRDFGCFEEGIERLEHHMLSLAGESRRQPETAS